MATKEDILEQIVEEYCLHNGYFVRHNIKFRPRHDHVEAVTNKDSNHSDIDILAYNPTKSGAERVLAISCKSWQAGFSPGREIKYIEENRVIYGRERWKAFRELAVSKWSEAFKDKIFEETGQRDFVYITAVTKVNGDKSLWERNPNFMNNMGNNEIRVLTLSQMISEILPKLSKTVAATQIGRLMQLLKAADILISSPT
jgi:hypothetical protein